MMLRRYHSRREVKQEEKTPPVETPAVEETVIEETPAVEEIAPVETPAPKRNRRKKDDAQ